MTDQPQTPLNQALDRIEVLEDKLAKQEVALCAVIEGFKEVKKLLGTHQGIVECHQNALKEITEVLLGVTKAQEGFAKNQLNELDAKHPNAKGDSEK